jgi:hypothetical protein
MKKMYKMLLLAFLIGVVSPKMILSQDDFRDKIEDIKLEKLTKKLELDESVKITFIDKYKTFSKSMRELNKSRAKAYKLMTGNIESGSGLDSLVNLVLDYESQISQKREDFIADMKSMLTSQQIAKMIVFERKFNTEIRKLLKQYQKDNKKEQMLK